MFDLEVQIEETLKKCISEYFKNKKVNTKHPLDYIFPKERRIFSIIHGLQTSIGTQLWEPLALMFARLNNYEILDIKKFNQEVPIPPPDLTNKIDNFLNLKEEQNLSNDDIALELRNYIKHQKYKNLKYSKKIKKSHGVDIWLKKNQIELLIDIKTTQLNAGSGLKLNQNLLYWYVYRLLEELDANINCIIAFPFNPYGTNNDIYWQKEEGKVKPLIKNKEALLADDFWDLLSGVSGTTEIIFHVFRKLGKEKFGSQFDDIFEEKN